MVDPVDKFIIRETKEDKIVVAILAAAVIQKKENVTLEEAADIYSHLFMTLRNKKLIRFP